MTTETTAVAEIEISAIAQAEQKASYTALEVAKTYVIESAEMAELAAEELKAIKTKQAELDEKRKAITRPLDEKKKQIMSLFKPAQDLLEQAENVLKSSIINWKAEESKRIRLENERQKELQRLAQEEANKRAREAEVAAQIAEQSGDVVKAEEFKTVAQTQAAVAEAIAYAPPVQAVAAPKLSGISSREDWKAEVVNLMALVQAVARGEAPLELIQANQTEINKHARALKSNMRVPGVRVYAEEVVAARRAR